MTAPARRATSAAPASRGVAATIVAARRLNHAAGTIAASVLIDSAMEHWRGDFRNRAMWTPLLASSLTIAASAHGHRDGDHGAHMARDIIYVVAGVTDIVGTGLHLYNVTKKIGGLSWQNLFYSAPLGTTALPGVAALGAADTRRSASLWWLRATAVMGVAGVALHAYAGGRTPSTGRRCPRRSRSPARDIPNLWVCDGSVFPTVGGVNPALTIQTIAVRTADRIRALAASGAL